ncbi:hypothetical protein LCZ91_22580 [Xanthomonas citri pv. mangiferaeindicae]|uniref:KfrB domain-containing protein n=1 Tax=Xanthomonas citri TaxID=346 RepID=UPI001CFEF1D2|nr:hypothetical protein [Xanthomonas citri]UDB88438.1 hypothetical protein LCZ91_22580 [Xanthomonas citri pv. mangiferaeindicae]
MSNDASNTSTTQSKAEDRIKPTDIPREIRATVAEKLGKEADVFPAKSDSKNGYKGPVIHADKEFIVQAIGKGQRSAIVHLRNDVEFQGPKLQSRDQNNDLVNRNIQVHYRDGQAKAYPWNPERAAENQAQTQRKTVDPVEAAKEYAQTAFKTAKQRDAFVAHVQGVQALAADMAKAPAAPVQEGAKTARSIPVPAKGQDKASAPSLER